MSGSIDVVIVDDHPVVREGLSAMLSAECDVDVVGEAATGVEALELFRSLKPAVMVIDLVLPDMHGTDVIRQICEQSGDVQTIVLTSASGDEEIYRALEAGARGYLFKDMARKELPQAIRAVNAGKQYIPGSVGARLAENLPRTNLSSREIEVLRWVASGSRNKEIAFELSISQATVNAHVKHILQKLGASDRTEAVTIALRRGVISL